MNLPTDRIVFQFDQTSVIYTAEYSVASGKVMPKLYVQSLDAYRYQRELIVQLRHEPGSSVLYWEYVAYMHPGRKLEAKVNQKEAERFILKFLEQCKKHPSLLFNKTGEHADTARPRNEGFVHLMEALHRGHNLSTKLL